VCRTVVKGPAWINSMRRAIRRERCRNHDMPWCARLGNMLLALPAVDAAESSAVHVT
jgi:hypothetical protein